VADWANASKLTLSLAKCEVCVFKSSTGEARYAPTVDVGGTVLRYNPNPRFLGVVLDRALSFGPHVTRVVTKVTRSCRLLRAVSGQNWGCRRATMYQLFMALVRGVLDYCGPAWQPWLSVTEIQRLERV
jgi:hypothetical protein